jgi:hypothetical protein
VNTRKTKGEEITRLTEILRKEGWEVSSIKIEPLVRTDMPPGGTLLKLTASPSDTAFLQRQ